MTADSPQAWPLSHPYGPRPASGSRSVLTVASLRRGGPQAPGAATTRIRAPSRRDARLHLIRSTGHGEGFGYLARLQVEGPRPLPLSQSPMHEMPPPFLNMTHPYASVRVWGNEHAFIAASPPAVSFPTIRRHLLRRVVKGYNHTDKTNIIKSRNSPTVPL